MPLFGTEIEYGIAAPGRPDVGADALAAAVIDAWDGPGLPSLGSRNRVLGNGARFYVDHGHVEYATPEVTSAVEAVRYEAAGDAIARRASELAGEALGLEVRLYRNNTDGKGNAYGYHENHLLRRSTPFEAIVAALPAYLVTRILYTGAGRVGLGPASEEAGFQLAQRADFFTRLTSLDTTRDRGLINTRDEPHARASEWRRLHVITGDATSVP